MYPIVGNKSQIYPKSIFRFQTGALSSYSAIGMSETKKQIGDKRKRLRSTHRAIRGQHRDERTEDYVESVYRRERKELTTRVVDLQKIFAVSHVTVIRAVDKLCEEGFLERGDNGITLTPKGKDLGARCYERHQLIESFLVSLGVSEDIASHDAEGIEHHLSPESLAAMRQHLGSSRSSVSS